MREIKFRAWIKNEYDGDDLVEYMEEDASCLQDPFGDHEDLNIILMQYTGLEDKNGTKIYEGDVLYFPLYETHTNNRIVKFELGQFVGELIRSNYSKALKEIADEMEVIGNIYENPELLNQ